MVAKLYMLHGSPPCRAVLAIAKALDIKLEKHIINLLEGQHLSPEYIKICPQHTVPLLDDHGSIICDSHAICAYLVDKYAKDDSLYPKDLYQRALVNEKLLFDAGSLFTHSRPIFASFLNTKKKSLPSEIIDDVKKSYRTLAQMLDGHQWFVGDNLTIADISLYTTLSVLTTAVEITQTEFPNIISWMNRVKVLPCFEDDDQEMKVHMDRVNSLLGFS